jgi:hypothetical protein
MKLGVFMVPFGIQPDVRFLIIDDEDPGSLA